MLPDVYIPDGFVFSSSFAERWTLLHYLYLLFLLVRSLALVWFDLVVEIVPLVPAISSARLALSDWKKRDGGNKV